MPLATMRAEMMVVKCMVEMEIGMFEAGGQGVCKLVAETCWLELFGMLLWLIITLGQIK